MECDKISVIVPVYNVSRYLDKCVSSLINQEYENLEIILVDDGSTDDSGGKCDLYANQDNRIRVIHKKNAGLGYARNSGIEIATGKYVVFVDSDDYADSKMITSLYETLTQYSADTVIGGFSTFVKDDMILSETKLEMELFQGREVVHTLLPRLIGSAPDKKDSIRMSVWNVIYSMELIKENHIQFPSEREMISEDIIFNLEYYRYSTRVATIESCYYCYRITEGSLTTEYRPERFELSKTLHKELFRKIDQIGLGPETKNRATRYFFILLRMCIRQEEANVSGKSVGQAIGAINKICRDAYVEKLIVEYPIDKLNFKQKAFLVLVQKRCAVLLYLFIKFMKRK